MEEREKGAGVFPRALKKAVEMGQAEAGKRTGIEKRVTKGCARNAWSKIRIPEVYSSNTYGRK